VIEARYHDTVNVLQALNGFAAQGCIGASPFDRVEWYQLVADTGVKPLIALASDNGASAALALVENRGHITPLRNWYSFTWRQLAPAGDEGERLLLAIARELKSRGHRVTLEPVPDEDGSATRLAGAFRAAGWRVRMAPCDVNHVLPLNGRSFAEYWDARPSALRNTLKRKANRVTTEILTSFDPDTWEQYERIYAASWKPAEDHPAMLRAFAEAEGKAGRLRLGLAHCDDRPIAAQFWTVESGIAYIHKLAHLESYKQLSAGTTLSAAMFAHVIDRDTVNLVDFGTGDQSYKADWMEEVRVRYVIDCLDPRQPRAWPALTKRAVTA
jgi:hypothetical protein